MRVINLKRAFLCEAGIIIAIFTLSMVVRLVAVIALSDSHNSMVGNINVIDNFNDKMAQQLTQGKGFENRLGQPTSWRPPLAGFYLAGIYAIFGRSIFAVRIIGAIIGSVNCIMIYLIGKNIFGKSIGLFSSLYASIYYGLIFFSAHIFRSENLFLLFMLVSIYFLLRVFDTRCLRYKFLAGIRMGLAALTR